MKTIIILLSLFTSCTTLGEVNDEVYFDKILTLPDNVYESIALSCGDGATYQELWSEYKSNKSLYNSLSYDEVYINRKEQQQ